MLVDEDLDDEVDREDGPVEELILNGATLVSIRFRSRIRGFFGFGLRRWRQNVGSNGVRVLVFNRGPLHPRSRERDRDRDRGLVSPSVCCQKGTQT